MANKFLVRRGNVLFASVFLLLAYIGGGSIQEARSQETAEVTAEEAAEENTEATAEGDGSGQILVPLSGTATASRIDGMEVSPNQIQFDLVDVGMSATQTFKISHSGEAGSPAIQIEEAVLLGKSADEFSSDFNGYQGLNAGESLVVTVTFAPFSPGDKAAGLRLNVTGSTSPYMILFTGNARYPLTSDLLASSERLAFGQALENSTSKKTITIENSGEEGAPVINVSAIQLSGINADAFIVDFSPITLNAGETQEISIAMSTNDLGNKSAQAEIIHDGANDSLIVSLDGTVMTAEEVPVNFSNSTLDTDQDITRGTTLQFGPDGRLYVGEMEGSIYVFDVTRKGKNNYQGTVSEKIDLIKNVQNHDDDGSNNNTKKRTMTGIFVTGSAAAPEIYASSSDYRQAAGPSGTDSNLDTNSGMLHKLTQKSGGGWNKQDLVRGLPRSEENHGPNGLVKVGNKIYLNVGGHTNMGAPSNNFAELPEYALSSAVLVIDLNAIGGGTYDLPTLQGGGTPFGGDDGMNQAKLVANGPVQIFAPGFRNAYDIVYTESGKFYVWDNGPNSGWGGLSQNCKNKVADDGERHNDGLHLVYDGYYGGHPNPTRGNKDNTFGGESPVEVAANPEECDYKTPGGSDGSLTDHKPSTNGLDEYTASNFGSAMKGDLIAAAFGKKIYRVELNAAGNKVTSKTELATNIGSTPLDLTSQGDGDIFPGTIWIVDNIATDIHILEPSDY